MGRQESIARSIVRPILNAEPTKAKLIRLRLLAAILTLLSLYQLPLKKIKGALFKKLRNNDWQISESEYEESFRSEDKKKPEQALEATGDMGYSGSTFYSTSDKRYLVKSVPRYFEHSFFRDDFLHPYLHHMGSHPKSLLIRIFDFLAGPYMSLGHVLGTAPTHHIIMENIMYGKEDSMKQGGAKWDDWDLKPTSYFYPERDIADGRLTSDNTKDKLADKFEDKMVLTKDQADELIELLEEDTFLLAECNAVDYSLFLVRIKAGESSEQLDDTAAAVVPDDHPFVPPNPPSWRTGIKSPDGKHIFRAAILDFFWAKHKSQPKFMTALIDMYNTVDRQGPMSITTEPHEYRDRFLKMVKEMIEIAK